MRRVVITGRGIVSSLGNSLDVVKNNLQDGNSGLISFPYWRELGLNSSVGGGIPDTASLLTDYQIPKRQLLCMPKSSLYAVLSAFQAIAEAELPRELINHPRTACIVGTGVGCVAAIYKGADNLYKGKINRLSPHNVIHSMSSSASANVANVFSVLGPSYSLSSACSTSAHCIGHAYQLIRTGIVDRALAGGAEDCNELITASFAALRLALTTHFNDSPASASRPFDRDRDGFAISGGGGIIVMEEYESARKRGANIICEISGYAANSDGYDIVHPHPEGEQILACMEQALADAKLNVDEVDYVCAHAASTQKGDAVELNAIRRLFSKSTPDISSTKSMGGHPIGAAGVHELIHCSLMMENDFVAPSINISSLDDAFVGMPVVCESKAKKINNCISNSFGFGGTNVVLTLRNGATV